ncbi:hypothetical protein M0R45_016397 [Rubus argutus]|uniref:Uncharacterized protein n=1 Tax=Rubus argutus TaxID=59490 RepID=A0AAW1XT86_RUBAR
MDSTTHTVDHNLMVTLHMHMNTLPIHNYTNTLALGMDILPPAGGPMLSELPPQPAVYDHQVLPLPSPPPLSFKPQLPQPYAGGRRGITTLDDYLHTIHCYMNTLAFGILRMDILPHAAVLFLCLIDCNHHDPFMITKHNRSGRRRLPLNHQVNLGHPSKTKRTLQWKSQSNCF